MLFEGMVPPLQMICAVCNKYNLLPMWLQIILESILILTFKVFILNQRCLLLKVLRPHVKTVGTKTATWNELHILCSLIIHQTRELTKQFLQENNLNQFLNLSNNDINIQKLWWLKVRVVMVTRVSELAPREGRVHGTDSERQISWTLLFNITMIK